MFLCLQYAKYGWYQTITSKNQATCIGCNLFFSTLKCHRSKLMFFVISSYFAENVVYQNVIFSLKTHFESKLRNKRSWKDLRLASIYRFFSVISDKLFQKPFSSQGHILINCDIFSHDIYITSVFQSFDFDLITYLIVSKLTIMDLNSPFSLGSWPRMRTSFRRRCKTSCYKLW